VKVHISAKWIFTEAHIRKILRDDVWTVRGNMLVKFEVHIPLTALELLAFYAQKFRGSRDPGHGPFLKILRIRVWTVPGKTHVKFEVRSFNHF